MKTSQTLRLAKQPFASLLAGFMIALGCGGAAQAMSTFVALDVQAQWPDSTNPGPVVVYNVTLTRVGQGDLDVLLSCAGLPGGATASFSPGTVRFVGQVPLTLTATLTVTCTNIMAVDPYPFTVAGNDGNGTVLKATNMAWLT